MSPGPGNGMKARRHRDVWVQPDEVTGLEQLKVLAMERWAMSGKLPPRHEFWQLEPATVEWMLKRNSIWAHGVYTKIMIQAMAPDATMKQLELAAIVSKDVFNRMLGKPTEKHVHAGHVLVEFSGLDPDRLPDKRAEDLSEVVDVTPVEGDDNEGSHGG